jgi:hypothetical protein
MRVAIYARVSTGEQNLSCSCASCGTTPSVEASALAGLSHYQTEHINRFGNHVLDLSQPPAPLPFALPIRSRSLAQATAPV